ncbi:MAG: hypothetical protein ACLPUO_19915 [Streptosporangiaceae bacterium]
MNPPAQAWAAGVVDQSMLERSLVVGRQFADCLSARDRRDPAKLAATGLLRGEPGDQRLLLSLVSLDRLRRLLSRLLDENAFLSPHGLRALSAYHRDHPYALDAEGIQASISYARAESTAPLFGGNSNWRGPVWFPANYLMVSILERYYRFFGDDLTIEYPSRSGNELTLDKVAADLQDRLITLFTRGADGRRPSSAAPSGCRTIPPDGTTSSSASTSTATTARGKAPPIRPAGPA